MGKPQILLLLIGTPNVGKSAFFHQITGADVIISNYPGTTVEMLDGWINQQDYQIKVVDLPGVSSLGAISEDELITQRAILEQKPDIILNVLDASNLERGLYLTLQLLELNYPMLVVLNMFDLALKSGMRINVQLLSEKLGAPVIATVATQGKNVAQALIEALKIAKAKIRPKRIISAGKDIESLIVKLTRVIQKNITPPFGVPARSVALKLLEGDEYFLRTVANQTNSEAVLIEARKVAREIAKKHNESAAFRIARERHGISNLIAKEVIQYKPVKPSFSQRLDEITTSAATGIPLMIVIFISLLLLLVYFGGWLDILLVGSWIKYVSPVLNSVFENLGSLGKVLNIGLDQGIQGILAVMFPYILVFFFALAILEDTGYLSRMAFVMDSIMHKIGLHGRAVVPLMGGFGCNVPAIMATRVLTSKREKLISCTLITMVPCSARTAVILGTVGFFLGIAYAFAIYGFILLIIFAVGLLLSKWLPGKVSGMIMEMPPLRKPMLKPVLEKTWFRMKHFFYLATPLLLLGSFLIGTLHVSGILNIITQPFSPLTTGWLGLPAITIIPLIYGFIRKEGALVLLVAIAGTSNLLEFMSPLQLFIYALVVAIYVPCLATEAVLARELGLKNAFLISIGTFFIALIVGGVFYRWNPFGLT